MNSFGPFFFYKVKLQAHIMLRFIDIVVMVLAVVAAVSANVVHHYYVRSEHEVRMILPKDTANKLAVIKVNDVGILR